ncbi:hypothetical protein [Sphaerisporangium perillae]|nr:hypothetical protein [Sphaerisporangium perillae]
MSIGRELISPASRIAFRELASQIVLRDIDNRSSGPSCRFASAQR